MTDIAEINQNNRKKKKVTIRKAIIASSQNQYIPMSNNDEIILTVGNTDLRTMNGRLQVRTKEGSVASLKPKGGSNFTTTSPTWIDVTGLSKEVEIYPVLKQKQTKLKRIISSLEKSKNIFKKIVENSPFELEWVDIDFGVIKARFRPKKKQQ